MSDDHTIGEDGTPLAAEYVLGCSTRGRDATSSGVSRRCRRSAPRSSTGNDGLVDCIRDQAVAPPPQTWANIENALNATPHPSSGLWNSLAFLALDHDRIGGYAAASIGLLVIAGRAPAPTAPLVAKLDTTDGQAGFVAAIDPARNGLTIVPASVTDLNQRVLELWLIAPGDKHALWA